MKRIVSLLIVMLVVTFGCGDTSKQKDVAPKKDTKMEKKDTAKAPSTDNDTIPDATTYETPLTAEPEHADDPKPEEPKPSEPKPAVTAKATPKPTGDWAQWGGSPQRNNTPVATGIPAEWDVGGFDLIANYFPILGFTKTGELKEQFEIQLAELSDPLSAKYVKLHMKVKPDSIYKDDYTTVDVLISKEIYLPVKIIANSTEEEIYEIKLLKGKINKKINDKVFNIKIPKGFPTPEIIPLKKKNDKKKD